MAHSTDHEDMAGDTCLRFFLLPKYVWGRLTQFVRSRTVTRIDHQRTSGNGPWYTHCQRQVNGQIVPRPIVHQLTDCQEVVGFFGHQTRSGSYC